MPNTRIFVELKRSTNHLQRHEHETPRALGHTVLVIDKIGTFMPSGTMTYTHTKYRIIDFIYNTPKCARKG